MKLPVHVKEIIPKVLEKLYNQAVGLELSDDDYRHFPAHKSYQESKVLKLLREKANESNAARSKNPLPDRRTNPKSDNNPGK